MEDSDVSHEEELKEEPIDSSEASLDADNSKPKEKEEKPSDGKILAILSIIAAFISLALSILSSLMARWITNEYMMVFIALILIAPIAMAVGLYVAAVIMGIISHLKMKDVMKKDASKINEGRKALDIVAIVFLIIHPILTLLINIFK